MTAGGFLAGDRLRLATGFPFTADDVAGPRSSIFALLGSGGGSLGARFTAERGVAPELIVSGGGALSLK